MKIIRTIILYAALGLSLVVLWHTTLRSPCSKTIAYDIGEFDSRFNISREEFLVIVADAEKPWEKKAGNDIFVYKPGARFKINIIWSQEQERLYKGTNIEKNLDTQQSSINSLQTRYQSAVSSYEKSKQNYENKLAKYEQEVSYWNERGGAPEPEFNQLQRDAENLDKQAQTINSQLEKVNTLAEQNNQKVENYNDNVSEFNDLFVEGDEFDAGNTDGTEINIYSYDGLQELETLLVHEFGHVLGIDHVDDPASVMYYLLNEQNQDGILQDADISALAETCRL